MTERCSKFNVEAIDAHLTRVDGSFQIEDGQTGYVVDENASVAAIYDYLTGSWVRGEDGSVALVMAVDEPKGKTEELAKVKDVLGTFTTSYSTSGASRSKNVANGCSLINGTTLYPGDTFSTYNTVKPFSTENGYEMAGSYLNGKVVDSIGGGICQVSTTLYNAVLRAELEVTERHNHSMIVTYVDPSADAAIAESSGKDFVFVNNTDYPIYIDGHTADKKITFTIYGVETRAKNRTVAYESEVIEKKVPEADQIIADASQPIGVISVSSAHIGYKARLWKIVKENGVEVSREQVNSSNYKMSPRTATVGIASPDPNATSQMQAAIATSSIDTVKATISNIKAQQAAAAASGRSSGGSSGGSGGTSKPNSNASVPGGNLNPPKTTNVSGSDVVNYAMQFVGKPYVWGGKDPNTGADCSGFTSYVYAHFGISIPSFSGAQRSCGQEVSYANAQAGDLICYAGHVAIYMGGGKIVHAKGTAYGIVGNDNATYKTIITVRRLL